MLPLSSSSVQPEVAAGPSSVTHIIDRTLEVIDTLEYMGSMIVSQQQEITDLKSRVSKLEGSQPTEQTQTAPPPELSQPASSSESNSILKKFHSVSLPTLPSMPSISFPKLSTIKLSSEGPSWNEFRTLLDATRKGGEEELNKGNFVTAKDIFRDLINTIRYCGYPVNDKKSEMYLSYLNLSKCYERLGELNLAYDCAKEACEYVSDKSNARAQMALCAALDNKIEDAKLLLNESFGTNFLRKSKIGSKNTERHLAIAVIYKIEKKYYESFNELLIVLKDNVFNQTAVTCLNSVVQNESNEEILCKMLKKLDSFIETLKSEKKPLNDHITEVYTVLIRKKADCNINRSCAQIMF